jgi:hypothetical protein
VYAILLLLVPHQLEIIGLVSNEYVEKFETYHFTTLRYLRNYARDYTLHDNKLRLLVPGETPLSSLRQVGSVLPLTHFRNGVKFRPMYRHPHRKRLFHPHFFGTIVSVF